MIKLPSSALPFGMAALLLVSLITGHLSQCMSPDPLPRAFSLAQTIQTKLEASNFPLLSPEETREHHLAGTHLFLDARSLEEYDQSHIPGAFPVPINAFDTYFPEIAPILLPDSPLIVYCSNPACDQALRLAERLKDAGYSHVSIYPAGYEAWTREAKEEAAP